MKSSVSQQMPLHVGFREDAVFEHYLPGENAVAVGTLRQALAKLSDHLIFLWGARGTGVSHLLQAAIHDLQTQGLDALYLPLGECIDYGPDALDGLDEMQALAIDDIDLVAEHEQWQEALFHLYNRMRDAEKLLIVGGQRSPLHLTLTLADLKSRLSSGLTLQLIPMGDEDRVDWVIWKGRRRGLVIERDVAEFLITRHNQNMSELVATFDQLDSASLAEKRRITIPFLKQVLAL
ncbi:DnaA regulatory inactivator Hda [Reinekea sp. G2M2-21]|uniref:DnaA regulatory inactivator Hda n=1 Tax=Reinekea sp. G2M2-21 TaxID=2788942 RepID=UPI0018AC0EE6|nr:DnaA regulatory inactivator Hda [Reinekea sp. G2M2-21]